LGGDAGGIGRPERRSNSNGDIHAAAGFMIVGSNSEAAAA
jgi:hypothetical protein